MRAVLILLVFITAAVCCTQDRPAELLREGIIAEETRHDLSAATQAYQSVLAQPGVDRTTAATALFRLAEVYRKQGNTGLAAASYKRVVQEYADQTELVKVSRSRLENAVVKNGTPDDALQKYRSILQREVDLAEQYLKIVQHDVALGAQSPLDTYPAQQQLAKSRAELAAFEAGLTQRQPAAPKTSTASRARVEYRQLLQMQIALAAKDVEAEQQKFNLGTSSRRLQIQKLMKLSEARRNLAAFDAGLIARPLPPTDPQ